MYICAISSTSGIEKYTVVPVEGSSDGYDAKRSFCMSCSFGQDEVESGRCVLFAD